MKIELEKEKKIITDIVLEARDEINTILDKFKGDKSEISKEKATADIVEYFLNILYRINRFSEFKSKFKVLKCGETISHKELERCKFVVKLRRDRNQISVLKNDITNESGIFKKGK
jgi:hypothetical protein